MTLSRFVFSTLTAASLVLAQAPQKGKAESSQDRSPTSPTVTNRLSPGESRFIQDAWESGTKEVEMARMGTTRAMNAQVKNFAERLVKDHTAANGKLEDIARKNGLAMTGVPDKGRDDGGLSAMTGTQFDQAFIKHMIENHEKGIAKYEMAQKESTNAELREYIASTLPVLREHLQQARSVNPVTARR